jgi:hypothetical protein
MRTAIDAKRLVVELHHESLFKRSAASGLPVAFPSRMRLNSSFLCEPSQNGFLCGHRIELAVPQPYPPRYFPPTFSGNLGLAAAPGGDDRGRQFALPPIVNRVVAHLFGILNRRPNCTSNFSLYPIQH